MESPNGRVPHEVITEVTAEQVRAARFRVSRDAAHGRSTPARIVRLSRVVLPGDKHTPAPQHG